MNDPLRTILLMAVAFLLPPLAVAIHGGIKLHFWISVILTLLGWLPGVLHAIFVLVTEPHDDTHPYL